LLSLSPWGDRESNRESEREQCNAIERETCSSLLMTMLSLYPETNLHTLRIDPIPLSLPPSTSHPLTGGGTLMLAVYSRYCLQSLLALGEDALEDR
jgi:hypothetical protein